MAYINTDLVFHQGNLQDYMDCPYRFYLKYIRRLAWPAPLTQFDLQREEVFRKGKVFHTLVYQHSLGMPLEWLSEIADQEAVDVWWNNFLSFGTAAIEKEEQQLGTCQRYYEITLQAELNGCRLSGVLDLLLVGSNGRVCIFDWKTGYQTFVPTLRAQFAERLQTKIYPLLVHIVRCLPTLTVPIHTVRMIYWFADNPRHPIVFDMDTHQLETTRSEIVQLIHQINHAETYPQTTYLPRCAYCWYCTYCEREDQRKSLEEGELNPDYSPEAEEADLMEGWAALE